MTDLSALPEGKWEVYNTGGIACSRYTLRCGIHDINSFSDPNHGPRLGEWKAQNEAMAAVLNAYADGSLVPRERVDALARDVGYDVARLTEHIERIERLMPLNTVYEVGDELMPAAVAASVASSLSGAGSMLTDIRAALAPFVEVVKP